MFTSHPGSSILERASENSNMKSRKLLEDFRNSNLEDFFKDNGLEVSDENMEIVNNRSLIVFEIERKLHLEKGAIEKWLALKKQ